MYCFFPLIESAENARNACINQTSFHNCEILIINFKLANISKETSFTHRDMILK